MFWMWWMMFLELDGRCTIVCHLVSSFNWKAGLSINLVLFERNGKWWLHQESVWVHESTIRSISFRDPSYYKHWLFIDSGWIEIFEK